MLLSLLLSNRRILSCFFFLLLVIFNSFLTILVAIERINVKLVPAVPAGTPVMLADEIIHVPLPSALKIMKILSM